MRLLCLGDVALADAFLLDKEWDVPGGVDPARDDRILVNWELPMGERRNPQPRTSGERLLALPGAQRVVRKWAPGFAAMATNHILDGGVDGLSGTLRDLESAGFTTLGAGLTREAIEKPLLWQADEGRLAVVNWVFRETNPDWLAVPGPNCWPGMDAACQTIQSLKQQADWVLVFLHWSDEIFPYPHLEDRQVARGLLEAGADLIVGHHPHVVRGMETFSGKPVFYSLGNFYFSDIPDGRGGWINRSAPRNREALGVLVTLRRGESPVCQPLSFWQAGGQTQPDPKRRAERRLAQMSVPLRQFQDQAYARWYDQARPRFNRWDYRVHFRLWQVSFGELARRVLRA
jgi:hypothetical protein